MFYINEIVKNQDDYSIWNKDGILNEYRCEDMMEEIKLKWAIQMWLYPSNRQIYE